MENGGNKLDMENDGISRLTAYTMQGPHQKSIRDKNKANTSMVTAQQAADSQEFYLQVSNMKREKKSIRKGWMSDGKPGIGDMAKANEESGDASTQRPCSPSAKLITRSTFIAAAHSRDTPKCRCVNVGH